jgi:hypothetical protein
MPGTTSTPATWAMGAPASVCCETTDQGPESPPMIVKARDGADVTCSTPNVSRLRSAYNKHTGVFGATTAFSLQKFSGSFFQKRTA